MPGLRSRARAAAMGGPGCMKLLFDQNLSHKLVGQLSAEFPGSTHVRDAGLATAPDPDVWL